MSELGMDGMRGGTDVSVAHRVGGFNKTLFLKIKAI